eukprot:gene2164-2482_t
MAYANATVRPAPTVQVGPYAAVSPGCTGAAIQTIAATFPYIIYPSPDSGALKLTVNTTISQAASCIVTPENPIATTGNLTVSCTGSFNTCSSLHLSVNLQAIHPSCNQPATSSASAVIPFGCCLITTSQAAYAVFTTNPRCESCGGSAIPYTAGAGGSTTGPLMADLGSTCGSDGLAPSNPGTLTNAFATVTCSTSTLMSFTVTAPAFSKLSKASVEYLIRCTPAAMAKCPAFTAVSSLVPASRYNVIEVSKVCLVDLAGSERVSKTRSEGLVLREAGHINKSLHILEQVGQ